MRLSRPLLKYFGSKFQTARYYPKPKFDSICEPGCGSASYSSEYPELEIILFDIDPEVVALLQWLIKVDSEEILALPCGDLEEGQDLRELGIPGLGADLIRRWQRVGRNDCWTVSKWGNLPGQWTHSTRAAIAENVKRIRHWQVFCCNYSDILLNTSDWWERTWFIDLPYQCLPASSYRFGSIDYMHLRNWTLRLPGQIIVCEQQGADWLPFKPFRTIAARCAASRRPGSKSREVIWTNEPCNQLDLSGLEATKS